MAEGNNNGIFYSLGNLFLGTSLIAAQVTSASDHALLGAIPSGTEEIEISARLTTPGSGGPWTVDLYGRVNGGSAAGDDVLLIPQFTINDQNDGARFRVVLGRAAMYDSIRHRVQGTFTGDTVALRAAVSGRDIALPQEGTARSRTYKIAPGAFSQLALTSSGVGGSETLTVGAVAYRAAR